MRVTWNQLRIFEAVARHGSFTRAAEELSVVQPTVSAQVRQLADAIGMPLFEQLGKKIYLTDAGRELQQTSRELFDAWSRFEMKIGDLKGLKSGRLQVAIVTTAKYFIPRLLGPFCRRYPGIDITLEIANRDQVLERFAENRDDLYIMGIPPEKFAIERFAFLENPLVVIAPREHELTGRKRIPLARTTKEPFIMREQGSGTRMAVERFFGEHGLALNVKMALGSNEAIKWAVAGGLGIAVLSQHALMFEPMHHRIAVLDVKGFPISQSWHVVYPAGKQLSVVAETFIDYLKQEAQLLREEMLAEERGRESKLP